MTPSFAPTSAARRSASAVISDVALSILHNTFIDGQRKQAAELRRDAEMARLTDKIVPPPQESSVRLHRSGRPLMPYRRTSAPSCTSWPSRGCSHQDAAAVLRIPIGTLMSRLGRARTALRAFETRPGDRLQIPAPDPSRSRPNLRMVGGQND